MATFLSHEPCPNCGSRDNLGRYSDGSAWCFGCHYLIKPNSDRSSKELFREIPDDELNFPKDFCHDFHPDVTQWLTQYDLKIEEALRWKWGYSPHNHQLIFPFYGDGELLAWQGRNFRFINRKYYTKGDINHLLPIFSGPTRSSLVLVEDCVSAAKIARQSDAMPLLGSHISATKISRLKPFYEVLVVWLDADKLKEARKIADMAKWIGLQTKVVYTEKDPKEYTNSEIKHLTSF